jgi:hypothetical protein
LRGSLFCASASPSGLHSGQFDPVKVARFDQREIAKLIENQDIIRSRSKIEATISGAHIFPAPGARTSTPDVCLFREVAECRIQLSDDLNTRVGEAPREADMFLSGIKLVIGLWLCTSATVIVIVVFASYVTSWRMGYRDKRQKGDTTSAQNRTGGVLWSSQPVSVFMARDGVIQKTFVRTVVSCDCLNSHTE